MDDYATDENLEALRELVMTSLADAQFNQYDKLHKRLIEADPNREGVLDASTVVDIVISVGRDEMRPKGNERLAQK